MIANFAISALLAATAPAQEVFEDLENQEIVFYEEEECEDVVLNEEGEVDQIFFEEESEDLLADEE